MSSIEHVKHELIQSDSTFRSLFEEHQEYKRRLDGMRAKSLPSEADEMEIKRIKLHKLTLKDQMEARVRDHLRTGAP